MTGNRNQSCWMRVASLVNIAGIPPLQSCQSSSHLTTSVLICCVRHVCCFRGCTASQQIRPAHKQRQNSRSNIIGFGFPSYIDNSAGQKIVWCMQTAMTNLSNGDKRFWVHLISTYVISWYVYKVRFQCITCHVRVRHDFVVTTSNMTGAQSQHTVVHVPLSYPANGYQ